VAWIPLFNSLFCATQVVGGDGAEYDVRVGGESTEGAGDQSRQSRDRSDQ